MKTIIDIPGDLKDKDRYGPNLLEPYSTVLLPSSVFIYATVEDEDDLVDWLDKQERLGREVEAPVTLTGDIQRPGVSLADPPRDLCRVEVTVYAAWERGELTDDD